MASSFPQVDPGRLASYQYAIQQDPDVQAAIRALKTRDMTVQAQLRAKYGVDDPTQIAIQKGITPPGGGYRINQDGKLDFFQSEAWYADPRFWGPVAVGVSGAYGAGAFGGGGSSAPSAGGVAHGGPEVGYNATGSVVGGAAAGANAGTIAGPGIAGVEGWETLGQTAGAGFSMADVFTKLAQAGIPIAALAGGRALSGAGRDANSGAPAIPEELQQLLALSMKRVAAQQPLADAINKQALGGLPTYAKGGQ